MSFVILYPDLDAQGTLGAFGEALAKRYPQATLVPVLNAESPEKLKEIAQNLPTRFDPVVSPEKGVRSALITGYRYVVEQYIDFPVVRLDTDEHPLGYIKPMFETVLRTDMVVGDLVFGADMLRAGSLDEFMNQTLFPQLYHHFTGGLMTLSGAYGFQAFAAGKLPIIFAKAQDVMREAEREVGHTFQWGFDAAMIFGAMAVAATPHLVHVPAMSMRDRSKEKIATQLIDTLAVCCAANRLFGFQNKTHQLLTTHLDK